MPLWEEVELEDTLSLFFVRKADDSALVISARDMTKMEQKLYGKK